MNKKPIIGGIILSIIIPAMIIVGAKINPDNPENDEIDGSRGLEYSHGRPEL